jgi:hypothetical protein
MRWLYKFRDEIRTSEQILALHAELQRNPQITGLYLSCDHIGLDAIAASIAALGELLQQNPQITSLNLERNQMGPDAIAALNELLRQNQQITNLDLSGIGLDGNGVQDVGVISALEGVLQGTNVTSLHLSVVSPESASAWGNVLHGSEVSHLSLQHDGSNLDTIGAVGGLLRQNQQITRVSLPHAEINEPETIAAWGNALNNTGVTAFILRRSFINGLDIIEAVGRLLRQNPRITEVDVSSNLISEPISIRAYAELLRQNPQITRFNLSGNYLFSSREALRELLQQNPQITSLDLSDTGLHEHELLSLVREFRHLHHVGSLDDQAGPYGVRFFDISYRPYGVRFFDISYRAQIEEQLRSNRELPKLLIRAAGVGLKRLPPELGDHIVAFSGVTMGLSTNEVTRLITEATSPAFNFQRGNPNAISFDAAAGGIPKISITFESRDGLRAFLANNGNTFRELEKIGAIVEDSGRGVEIIAPNTSGGILRGEMVAIRKELTPLWRKLEDSRSDAAHSAIAAHEPVMELSGLDENKDAPEARPVGRLEGFGADAEMATIRKRLDNHKVSLANSRPESTRSTSQVAGAGRYEERDLPGLDEGNDEKAAADPGRTITNAQAAAPVPEVGQHTQSVVAARSAVGSPCCSLQ